MNTSPLLRPFWHKLLPKLPLFGLVLILLWGIPRFILVLQANVSGNYQAVSYIFLTMWVAPWILLSKSGRRKIGLTWPKAWYWLPLGFLLGALIAFVIGIIAFILYDHSISNWYVYISNSYADIPQFLLPEDKRIYFWIYATVSMIFSPIGEELFYRGIVHECFATDYGDKKASYIDSAAFAITHLAHFGTIYHLGAWKFLPVPAFLWMILLFGACLFFSYARRKSGSILGAILAHAGFNFAMIYVIFYHIL
jgi:hypothetical protein